MRNVGFLARALLLVVSIVAGLGPALSQSSTYQSTIVTTGAGQASWALPGASLDLDFVRNQGLTSTTASANTAASFITTTRASSAWAPNAAGVYSEFLSNVPRITNLGLLVEESRTNSIRNNSMQGAVAGSPGTAPTNWTTVNAGLTRTIVGTGTENGVDYIDIRFNGTTSATVVALYFDASTAIAATNGQTWTASAFLSRVGGSSTNVTATRLVMDARDAGGGFLAQYNSSPLAVTSSQTGFSAALTTANASTAFVLPYVTMSVNNASAVDITLRIGWPQLELGSFATSPIRTTSAAATRAADVITVNNFSSWFNASEGTRLVEWQFTTGASTTGSNRGIASFDDGTLGNRILNLVGSGSTAVASRLVSGGVGSNPGDIVSFGAGTNKVALAYAVGASQGVAVLNGSTPATSSPASTFSGVTTARLGNTSSGTEFINGYIRRVAYFPARLTNAQLQAITQ